MDGHFHLDLEASGQNGKGLDKGIAEGPQSCHRVMDPAVKHCVDHGTYDPVAGIVEGPAVFCPVGGGQPVSGHHIRLSVQDKRGHLPAAFRGVGVIAVRQYITVRVDLPEHPADHIAFSLHVFPAHDGPVGLRDPSRPVRAVVVIDIDRGFGQLTLPVLHHFGNGLRLIEAGNENSDLVHAFTCPFPEVFFFFIAQCP